MRKRSCFFIGLAYHLQNVSSELVLVAEPNEYLRPLAEHMGQNKILWIHVCASDFAPPPKTSRLVSGSSLATMKSILLLPEPVHNNHAPTYIVVSATLEAWLKRLGSFKASQSPQVCHEGALPTKWITRRPRRLVQLLHMSIYATASSICIRNI